MSINSFKILPSTGRKAEWMKKNFEGFLNDSIGVIIKRPLPKDFSPAISVVFISFCAFPDPLVNTVWYHILSWNCSTGLSIWWNQSSTYFIELIVLLPAMVALTEILPTALVRTPFCGSSPGVSRVNSSPTGARRPEDPSLPWTNFQYRKRGYAESLKVLKKNSAIPCYF